MGEKFYLQFNDEERVLIDEPFGYDGAVFNIEQEDKRYARDIIFSSGEVSFEFTDMRNHYLERLLQFNDQYGFEAKVMLIIEKSGTEIKLDIDFKNGETDGITYFKCKLIQDSKLQAVKRLREANINVFSDIGLNGEPIEPLVPENILLKALPIVQKSVWTSPPNKVTFAQGTSQNPGWFNRMKNLEEYGIQDSYIGGILEYYEGSSEFEIEQLAKIVTARNNLDEVKSVLKLKMKLEWVFAEPGSNDIQLQGRVFKGRPETFLNDLNTSTAFMSYILNSSNPVVDIDTTFEVDLGFVARDQNIYFVFIHASNGNDISKTTFIDCKMTLTANSIDYNVVTPSLRLYDVMRYVVKSIAGLDIDAPRFEPGGYFHDQRLFNGNFLRNNPELPFYVTLKDLEEGLSEWNADYEIQSDDSVFFGLYEDFYRDEEIAFFPDTQFDEFSKSYNDRYCIQLYENSYSKYQSQKENTEQNTQDSIHGESQWKMANTMVDNKREVKIGWVRDAFLIEATKRKAITEVNNTATQDDDTLFLIDIIPTVSDSQFTETAYIQHSVIDGATLALRNDGTFSWLLLGITNGSFFIINAGSPNAGIFIVADVTNNILTLSNTGNYQNIIFSTTFTYTIEADTLAGQNWTNEGFSAISNIANGDKFYNLRFSLKRNIVNYHNQYLATANLYKRLLPITNTFYKNNPDATTTYGGLTVTEGAEFVPSNPILSPVMYKDMIFIAEFDKFVSLQDNIRSRRGFVRAIDNNGNVFKFYPKKMGYSVAEETIMIEEGEEKFEPVVINIVTNADGTLTINNEYTMIGLLYEIQGEKVRIMDNQNYLLYNPIFWNRIAVNGVLSDTLNELQSKLLLL